MIKNREITERIGEGLVAKLGDTQDSVVEWRTSKLELGPTASIWSNNNALEDEFDIEISDRDAESLKTVGDVSRCEEEF